MGERPHGTVAEWLEWAEVDLDLPANEGVNEQWLTGSDAFYQVEPLSNRRLSPLV